MGRNSMEEDNIETTEPSYHPYEGSIHNLIDQTGAEGLFDICIALKALELNKITLNPKDVHEDFRIRIQVINDEGGFELELLENVDKPSNEEEE
jgi:hypothetical protein